MRAPSSGKASAMPAGETPGSGCSAAELEPRVGLLERQAAKARHRVDPARRQEHQLGAVAAGELETVVGAEQVRSHDVVGAAVEPGERGWLGRALHSASTDPALSRSSSTRTSPCSNATPASRSRGRFSSAPRRWRLSSAAMSQSGWRSASPIATLAPMNPAPPVTSTRISRGDYACRPQSAPAAGSLARGSRSGSLDCSAVRSLPTRLDGPVLIEPAVHGDARGFFLETYRRDAAPRARDR